MSKKRILLVEDEENFGAVLKNYLELADYEVRWYRNGNLGFAGFRKEKFDLCVLDVMMPERDGFTLAADIRKEDKGIPLIFLTAKGLKEDQLKGYQVGADDYLTKPFDSEVLLWKIKAILKRDTGQSAMAPEAEYAIGKYTFRTVMRTLEVGGEEQRLSPKEAQLLTLLCQHANDVMPREQALEQIWKEDSYFTTRSMDVFIAKLRKYLKNDPKVEIVNVHGNGFSLRY